MHPSEILAPSSKNLNSGTRGHVRLADVSIARTLTPADNSPRLQHNLDVITVLTDFSSRFCTTESSFFLLTKDDFVFCRGYELQLAMLVSYFQVSFVFLNGS